MSKLISFFLVLIYMVACKPDNSDKITGLWQIEYFALKGKKEYNLAWQGIKIKKDGSFVSWNTRQHFAGNWKMDGDTLFLMNEETEWINSKWLLNIYTHPHHFRRMIEGKLLGTAAQQIDFTLSKVHHLAEDHVNTQLISQPGPEIQLLGKWKMESIARGDSLDLLNEQWVVFNENNTYLMGQGEEKYGNHGVWLLDRDAAKISLISFSNKYPDSAWEFELNANQLIIKTNKQEVKLSRDVDSL